MQLIYKLTGTEQRKHYVPSLFNFQTLKFCALRGIMLTEPHYMKVTNLTVRNSIKFQQGVKCTSMVKKQTK